MWAVVGTGIRKFGSSLVLTGKILQQFGRRVDTLGWRTTPIYLRYLLHTIYVEARNRSTRKPRGVCPCCGWRGYDFWPIDCGTFLVYRVECPRCRGSERHRMLSLYADRVDDTFRTARGIVLHCGPERQVRKVLIANAGLLIVSADYEREPIEPVSAPVLLNDLQQTAFADNSLDLVFCLHVLEHIPDDRRAISEIYRVLKPGGVAYVMVPFMIGWKRTIDFDKPDPLMFDHLRGYSVNDFKERLSPFHYDEIFPGSFLSREELDRYGIPGDSQVLYRCTKPESPEGQCHGAC